MGADRAHKTDLDWPRLLQLSPFLSQENLVPLRYHSARSTIVSIFADAQHNSQLHVMIMALDARDHGPSASFA